MHKLDGEFRENPYWIFEFTELKEIVGSRYAIVVYLGFYNWLIAGFPNVS